MAPIRWRALDEREVGQDGSFRHPVERCSLRFLTVLCQHAPPMQRRSRILTLPPPRIPCWSVSPESYAATSLMARVTAMLFSPDSASFFYLALNSVGEGSLSPIDLTTGESHLIAGHLDVSLCGGQIALSPDQKSVYPSLASHGAPSNEMRSHRYADRWLKISQMDLATGDRHPVVATAGRDNFGPAVAGNALYWVRSEVEDSIVALPSTGGVSKQVIAGGQVPMWNLDGSKIAYFFGDTRLADEPLDIDDAVVGVNSKGTRKTQPFIIVSGYHEDFPPAWSPNGKWIAFHSHRSPAPIASYHSKASTDDLPSRSRRCSCSGDTTDRLRSGDGTGVLVARWQEAAVRVMGSRRGHGYIQAMGVHCGSRDGRRPPKRDASAYERYS
ncbi:hypothetical protein GRAN_5082 [Granulicella sibirica]|uniref:TolB protein n=1 Tax=Granulicella sibirica TaxID=2479048 RepID=A0A4V1L4X1_9BACT|nr:hypothetical protein GRAN_5082 [Granulicella sibirica]